MKKESSEGWQKLYHSFFDNNHVNHLGPYTALVWLCICRHADENSKAFPGFDSMQERLGFSRSVISEAVKELVSLGYLMKTSAGRGAKNEYTIIYDQLKIKHPGKILSHKKNKTSSPDELNSSPRNELVKSGSPDELNKKPVHLADKTSSPDELKPVHQMNSNKNNKKEQKKKNPSSTSDLLDLGDGKNLIAQNMARMWNDHKPVGWVECPADGRQLFIKIEALYPSVPHPVMLKGQLHHVLIYINDADGLRNETKDFGFLWNADRFRTFEALGKARKEVLEQTYQLNKNPYLYIKLENLLKDRLKDFKNPLTPGGDRTINVRLLELVEDSRPVGFYPSDDINDTCWYPMDDPGIYYSLFMSRTKAMETIKAKAETQKASPQLLTKH